MGFGTWNYMRKRIAYTITLFLLIFFVLVEQCLSISVYNLYININRPGEFANCKLIKQMNHCFQLVDLLSELPCNFGGLPFLPFFVICILYVSCSSTVIPAAMEFLCDFLMPFSLTNLRKSAQFILCQLNVQSLS